VAVVIEPLLRIIVISRRKQAPNLAGPSLQSRDHPRSSRFGAGAGSMKREQILPRRWFGYLILCVPPGFSGDDDWLSEIDVPAPSDAEETEDFIRLGRESIFSRMRPRHRRLMQVAAIGIIGTVLLSVLLVRTVSGEGPFLPPPAAVAGLSFQSFLMPTMASECMHGGCTNEAASDQDLASLRRFLGATFWIQGDRVRDRHGMLRGLAASAQDGAGDDLELSAISTPSVPAHWARTIDDGTARVSRTTLRTTEGLWLVESRAEVAPWCDGVVPPLWNLARSGANADQLHI
jgi:hypothetical protein